MWVLASSGDWACFPVLLLPSAVHAEEGLAEPHDQAAWSPQAPCCECPAVRGRGGPALMLGLSLVQRVGCAASAVWHSQGGPAPPSPWPCSLCPVPPALQCPTCDKCFLTRTELQLHEAFKHRGEKLFVCEECGHRASSRNGLQMHIKAKHRCGLACLPTGPVPAAGSGQRVGREGRIR